MPTLIVSSLFSTDSRRLRNAAQERGWETFRLDGLQLPDWFEPLDDRIAMFCTAPSAFQIAEQLSHCLLGCNPEWTTELEAKLLLRELRQTRLQEALQRAGRSFIKHAVSKAFPADAYDSESLARATQSIPHSALVHVGEIVDWTVEYRCFVNKRKVAAISPYKRYGHVIDDPTDLLGAPPEEIQAAKSYANSVLATSVNCPDAFVLDVGIIDDRGWAVVECNECWASGIYGCDPNGVLDALLSACVRRDTMTELDRRWDFEKHYFSACSDGRRAT